MPKSIELASLVALLSVALPCFGCGGSGRTSSPETGPPPADVALAQFEWSAAPALPTPVANNATAALMVDGRCHLYSFMGIGAARTHEAITRSAHEHVVGDEGWSALPDVPSEEPLVAASAVALGGKVYLLGGYSVAASGQERSFSTLHVLDPRARSWSLGAPLPTAIDDAVAVAWRDRYIVVVSGWSDTRNVATVQLYDAEGDHWSAATDFPGVPAFGHAGAIIGDELLVVDGVRDGPFELLQQAVLGRLDPAAPTEIAWTQLPATQRPGRYRSAAGRLDESLVFAGGTSTPYNFNGLSYGDSQPAPPLTESLVFSPSRRGFERQVFAGAAPTMDHRGLVGCGDSLFVVGGMVAGPVVTAAVLRLDAL